MLNVGAVQVSISDETRNELSRDAAIWKGRCLDERCKQVLMFTEDELSVTCYVCGQTHEREAITDKDLFDPACDPHLCLVRSLASELPIPKRPSSTVKVRGFSHYHHKLVAPYLTKYGCDVHKGKSKCLKGLTGSDIFDCSVLADKTYRIESRHINIKGFGKDGGTLKYLADTLDAIMLQNNGLRNLVPLYVDGDGHCLVHSISRAAVGWQLFWHALRTALKDHFLQNLEKYQELLGCFIHHSEWKAVIDECDPQYQPRDGGMVGLTNIHILGLSNLLKRPIILLDSMTGMKASVDYAATFLPALNSPISCCNKDGQPNPPLCIAWANAGRNHYVPLVPVLDQPLPRIPKDFLPTVWAFNQDLLECYMKIDDGGCVTIGGELGIPHQQISKLTRAADNIFANEYGICPGLAVDALHYQFRRKIVDRQKSDVVTDCSTCMRRGRLLRCISCRAISVVQQVSAANCKRGGRLYKEARTLSGGKMQEGYRCPFPSLGITCVYDSIYDELVIDSYTSETSCEFCNSTSTLRHIGRDGVTRYRNGDRTNVPLKDDVDHGCPCGFRHWWSGKIHETWPVIVPVILEWNGITRREDIPWFVHEKQPNLNTDIVDIAFLMTEKHFPEDSGNDELRDTVLAQIVEGAIDAGVFGMENRDCQEEPHLPENPDEPEEPVVPDVPEEPVVPDVPEEPVVPDVPEEPVVPDVPEEPVVPDVPEEPVVPDVPEEPVVPDVPEEPAVPDVPEEPVVPDVPEEPVVPDVPEEPVVPDVPEEPVVPDVPEEPVVPDVPEEPVVPDVPEEPVVPDVPEEPVVPDVPEEPVVPDVPEEPVVPEEPEVPEEPGCFSVCPCWRSTNCSSCAEAVASLAASFLKEDRYPKVVVEKCPTIVFGASEEPLWLLEYNRDASSSVSLPETPPSSSPLPGMMPLDSPLPDMVPLDSALPDMVHQDDRSSPKPPAGGQS